MKHLLLIVSFTIILSSCGSLGLKVAAGDGDHNKLRSLIAEKPSQEKLNDAFRMSVFKGQIESMKILLDSAADINWSKGEFNNLFWAIKYENYEAAKFLIENGIDTTWEARTEYDAYKYAVDRGQYEIAKLIKKQNYAILLLKNPELALFKGDLKEIEEVRKILDNGHPINKLFTFNLSLLGEAVRHCNLDRVNYLVLRGADINKIKFNTYLKDWNKTSILHFAAQHDCPKILEYSIKELNIPIGLVRKKQTALSHAAAFGNVKAVETLISLGANLNDSVYGKKYKDRNDWLTFTKRREIELDKYVEKKRKERLARKQLAKQQQELEQHKTDNNNNDSWFGNILTIGTVAGIASGSGISSADKLKVISATATDVINDTGGRNLESLKRNQTKPPKSSYVSSSSNKRKKVIAQTSKQEKPQSKLCPPIWGWFDDTLGPKSTAADRARSRSKELASRQKQLLKLSPQCQEKAKKQWACSDNPQCRNRPSPGQLK